MHFNENTLFDYSLRNEALPVEVTLHLDKCAYCRERYEFFRSINAETEERININGASEELVDKLAPEPERRLLPEKDFRIVPKAVSSVGISLPGKNTLQRLFNYYPRATALSFAFLGVLSLMLLFIPARKEKMKVVHVKAKEGFLIAYDNSGEKAWAKFIGEGFGDVDNGKPYIENSPLQMLDVEGDGIDEILLSTSFTSLNIEERQYLYCYNNDGSLRWKNSFKPNWHFREETVPDIYTSPTFLISQPARGKVKKVYFVFTNGYYFPSALAEVNPRNGEFRSVYYNPGAIAGAVYSSDFDSLPRLFVFGENNSYNKAFIGVLNPDNLKGAAPGDSLRTPIGVSPADHFAYILFPSVLPPPIPSSKRDVLTNLKIHGDSALVATILVKVDNVNYALLFHFDNKLNCIGLDADDLLRVEMEKRRIAGKPYVNITPAYLDSLKHKISFVK